MDTSSIIFKEDFLLENEYKFLNKVCERFTPSSTPKDNKHYYKQTIDNVSELKSFLERSKKELEDFYQRTNEKISIGEIWINKVTPETNRTDKVHFDKDELTSVTFLNDDFIGGELEIQGDKSYKKVKPQKGTTLFFYGSKLPHRVLPVTEGERYTLIVFWVWNKKKEKSIF